MEKYTPEMKAIGHRHQLHYWQHVLYFVLGSVALIAFLFYPSLFLGAILLVYWLIYEVIALRRLTSDHLTIDSLRHLYENYFEYSAALHRSLYETRQKLEECLKMKENNTSL